MNKKKSLVLIAETDEKRIKKLKKTLKSKYEIEFLKDLKHLDENISANKPQLLLISLNLLDKKGRNRISTRIKKWTFPLLILIGSGEEEKGRVLVEEGAFDYLELEERSVEDLSRFIEDTLDHWGKQRKKDTAGKSLSKSREQSLIESEKTYRQAIENASGVPYRLHHSDYNYEFIGAGIESLLDISAEEFVYKNFSEIIEKIVILDPEAPQDPVEYGRAYRAGKFSSFRVDLKIKTFKGHEKWLSDHAVPIKDAKSGKITGSLGILLDITERKYAEKALLDSEERYRKLFETADEAIFLLAGDCVIDCNPKAVTMFGIDKSVFIGESFHDLSPEIQPDGKKSANKILNKTKLAGKGESQFFEWQHQRSDKTPFEAEINLSSIELSGQDFTLAIIRDISERKKAEKALRESEEQYRLIFEKSPLGIMHYDRYGTVITTNVNLERILGAEADQLIGMKMPSTLRNPKVVEEIKKSLAGETGHYEGKYVSVSSGKTTTLKAVFGPVFSEDGIVSGGIGIVEDITISRRIESERESLRRLAQRLTEPLALEEAGLIIAEESRNVFEHDFFNISYFDEIKEMSIGIYCEDTPIGAAKPQRMPLINTTFEIIRTQKTYTGKSTLLNRSELPDKSEFLRIGAEDRLSMSLMFVPIQWAGKNIGELSVQSYIKNKYSQTDLELLETFASQCGGFIMRIRADHERSKLESQIQHAQKLESLGVLAGGIAHDFNNLLMGILGNASLALLDLTPESPVRETILQIELAAQRAADLTKQMLAYSGKGRFHVENFNLNRLVKEMGHLLEVSVSKKAIIKYNLLSDLPNIKADATQIRQIIMNLITNASESIGEESGAIRVTTGTLHCEKDFFAASYLNDDLPEGEYVYIEVSDTGSGMDNETVSRIFDPFYTTKFTGRGLGLAAVLGIVRGHKGAIKVYSEPEQGTTFKIFLPASGLAEETEAPKITKAGNWKGHGLIMVVDDDTTIRKLAKSMLERIGFQVLTAKDGQEAIELFKNRAEEIKLVLLDMTMPRMNGKETFSAMRNIKKDILAILSSGYNEQDAIDRFKEEGLAGFIQKPYQFDLLETKIKEVFAKAGEN